MEIYKEITDIKKIKSIIKEYLYCVKCPYKLKFPRYDDLTFFADFDWLSDEENEERYQEYCKLCRLMDLYNVQAKAENGKNLFCIKSTIINYWEIAYELNNDLIIKTSKLDYYIIKSYKQYC